MTDASLALTVGCLGDRDLDGCARAEAFYALMVWGPWSAGQFSPSRFTNVDDDAVLLLATGMWTPFTRSTSRKRLDAQRLVAEQPPLGSISLADPRGVMTRRTLLVEAGHLAG